jgi:hypothetical protein
MLTAMLYIDLFRDADREGGFHRLNSSYSEAETIKLAQLELEGRRFPWARAFEVVNDQADILALGIKDT